MAWLEADSPNALIKVVSSTDGGSTFSSPQTIVTGIYSDMIISTQGANSFPSIAVDNSGGEATPFLILTWRLSEMTISWSGRTF